MAVVVPMRVCVRGVGGAAAQDEARARGGDRARLDVAAAAAALAALVRHLHDEAVLRLDVAAQVEIESNV